MQNRATFSDETQKQSHLGFAVKNDKVLSDNKIYIWMNHSNNFFKVCVCIIYSFILANFWIKCVSRLIFCILGIFSHTCSLFPNQLTCIQVIVRPSGYKQNRFCGSGFFLLNLFSYVS